MKQIRAILAALSLLLCVGFGVLWAASINDRGEVWWVNWSQLPLGAHVDAIVAHTQENQISLGWMQFDYPQLQTLFMESNLPSGFSRGRRNSLTGFTYDDAGQDAGVHREVWNEPSFYGNRVVLVLPTWMVMMALLVLPALWISREIRDLKRERRGIILCTGCGYDLRATPDRCPECGRETRKRNTGVAQLAKRYPGFFT